MVDDKLRYRYADLAEVKGRTLRGVLLRYGDVAKGYKERILAGAFGDLSSADILLNLQHDRGRPLARTGGGLTLTDGPEHLQVTAVLPETRDADDALKLIESGVLRGLSCEFFPTGHET